VVTDAGLYVLLEFGREAVDSVCRSCPWKGNKVGWGGSAMTTSKVGWLVPKRSDDSFVIPASSTVLL